MSFMAALLTAWYFWKVHSTSGLNYSVFQNIPKHKNLSSWEDGLGASLRKKCPNIRIKVHKNMAAELVKHLWTKVHHNTAAERVKQQARESSENWSPGSDEAQIWCLLMSYWRMYFVRRHSGFLTRGEDITTTICHVGRVTSSRLYPAVGTGLSHS